MSVAEILNSAAGLDKKEFENLYKKLSVLRVQKQGTSVLDKTEATLLKNINKAFPADKWERLQYLDWKLEHNSLNKTEEQESLKLAEAYENYYVERVKNMAQLAALRQISIEELATQLGIYHG
jgi:hypothetical protein